MHALHKAISADQPIQGPDAAAHDAGSNGYAKVVALARNGQPQPAQVAAVVEQHPEDKARIVEFLQQKLGNGFTQKVFQAMSQASSKHDGHGDDGKKHDHDKQPDTKGDDGQIHIITDAGLRHLRQSGPAGILAAKDLFNNPHAYIVLKAGQHMPEGWKGNATMLFPSFESFHAAHKAGSLPKNLDAVVYDNEHWQQTPLKEKEHASHFAKKFGELAAQLGLTYIAAPTRKFFAADARYADIVDVQLQDREAHTGSYAKALQHDAALAKRENPDVKVVGQITSSVRHLDPTHSGRGHEGIEKAEHDVTANADEVDGFWGYVYQQNEPSIDAGTTILKDLDKKKRKGAKI
jgi:hypothetical protein